MSTLDESLIHPSIAVLHLVAPLRQLFRGKKSMCVQLRKVGQNWLLCVARKNLRLKNLLYLHFLLKSGCLHLKLQKRESYNIFSITVNICVHHGHESKQKLTKTLFSWIFIRDLRLPPIHIFNLSRDSSPDAASILLKSLWLCNIC